MSVRTTFAALALLGPAGLASQNVAEVQVAPPSVTIKVGERTGLLATAFDRVGNVIPTVRLIWQSNNIQVAKVDNDGTVTGVSGGVAIIEARVGTRKGQAVGQVVGASLQAGGGQAPAPPRPPTGQQPPPQALRRQPRRAGPRSVLRMRA